MSRPQEIEVNNINEMIPHCPPPMKPLPAVPTNETINLIIKYLSTFFPYEIIHKILFKHKGLMHPCASLMRPVIEKFDEATALIIKYHRDPIDETWKVFPRIYELIGTPNGSGHSSISHHPLYKYISLWIQDKYNEYRIRGRISAENDHHPEEKRELSRPLCFLLRSRYAYAAYQKSYDSSQNFLKCKTSCFSDMVIQQDRWDARFSLGNQQWDNNTLGEKLNRYRNGCKFPSIISKKQMAILRRLNCYDRYGDDPLKPLKASEMKKELDDNNIKYKASYNKNKLYGLLISY
jgi:hypothetical protein